MATGLRPLKLLALWIGVPVGLYAVGYNFVGPRIGSRVPEHIKQIAGDQVAMLNKQVQRIVTPPPQGATSKQEAAAPKQESVATQPAVQVTTAPQDPPDSGGPEVQVSVRNQSTGERTDRSDGTPVRHRPKLHHKPKPKPQPKPETTDEGSYGGTQDQGTSTGTSPPDPPTGG
jgi:hypothetical protein